MKKGLLILFSISVFLCLCTVSFGQISESFESGLPSSYNTSLITATLSSGDWQVKNVIAGTTGVNSGTKSAQIRSATGAQIITPTLSGGVGEISFYVTASTSSGAYQVNISTDDGVSWAAAPGSPFTISTTKTLKTITVNNSSVNKIQIYRTGATIYIDDFSTTTFAGSTPLITVSPSTLTAFSYTEDAGPGAEQTFTVEGSNLTSDISIAAPANYEISLSSGSGYTSPLTLTQSGGSVTTTTIYVRLKSGLSAGTYNSEVITASSTGATDKTVTCSGYVVDYPNWCNLQSPGNGTITTGGVFNVYARIYEPSLTEAAGQGAGVTCWIGYNSSDTNPDTWTNWVVASYNTDNGNNDEYVANIGSSISSAGTYYYASRFSLNGGTTYSYGGYNGSGGGFWDGTTYVSGILTINSNYPDWCNLQWPASGTINVGDTYNAYAQIYESGVTEAAGAGANVSCWIGYNSADTDPSTWTNWVAATFNAQSGNNDEFVAEIGSALSAGTYYYASRFKVNPNADEYSYGGYNGGTWDGSSNVSGILNITQPIINVNPATITGFTYVEGSGPSAEQSFTIEGANLTSDISIAAPADYEISLTSGSGYTTPLTLTQSGGTVSSVTVYVRLKSGLIAGDYNNENITATSTGATDKTVGCNGTVTVSGAPLVLAYQGFEVDPATPADTWTYTGTCTESTTKFSGGTQSGRLDGSNSIILENIDITAYDDVVLSVAFAAAGPDSGEDLYLDISYDNGSTWTGAGSVKLIDGYSNTPIDFGNTNGADPTTVATNPWTVNIDNAETQISVRLRVVGLDVSEYYYVDDIQLTGLISGPTIVVNPSSLSGLDYVVSNGPSSEQSFSISGYNLTGDISITPPANYEISTGSGGSFLATNPVTLTQSGGSVASSTIYVRLKAGLAAGDYNNEDITATSTDATDKTVTCNGSVTTPALSVSETALTGFTYIYGNGPAASQTFTVSGSSLSNDLVVTAPADYEVSDDDVTFGASVSLTPVSNTVAVTTIYVRLKAGLAIGEYNLEDVTISSTGATSETLACSGNVTLAPVTDLNIGCTSNTTAEITWTAPAGNYEGVIIAFRNSATLVPHTISDGTDPSTLTAVADFASGTEFGSTTPYSYIVYKGTGTSITVTGLTAGETYKVKAYTYSGTNWLSNTDCPTVTVSNLGLSDVNTYSNADGDSESELTWNNPGATCFDEVLIVCHEGASVSATPGGDGSSYTADAVFGSGTDIGTNEYVIYKGTGTSMTVTGLTNDLTYYATIFVRQGTQWSAGVELILYPTTVTILQYGDLAIFAVNTSGTDGDEFSIVSFKAIANGTSIDFTDNGYERVTAGLWADSEGVLRFTRQNSNIGAGKVITFETVGNVASPVFGSNVNVYLDGDLDNANWTCVQLGNGSGFNFNDSDQIWVMQGGTWSDPAGTHNATYSGNVLYGWTAIGWYTSPGYDNTAGSTIYPGCECATTNVSGLTNKSKVKYTGSLTAANRTQWIGRVNDPTNWTGWADNVDYDANLPLYKQDGQTISIEAGDLTSGKWAGYKDGQWCNCGNWYSLVVPDATINVEIPAHAADRYDLVLSAHADSLAYCNDINVIGDIYNVDGAQLFVGGDFELTGGSVNFNTNAVHVEVGGDIIIDDNTRFLSSKADLVLNGTTDQSVNSEAATLVTLALNSLAMSGGGTKTIADKLDIENGLLVDNSIFNMSSAGSSLNIDGNIVLQNGATMHDNCKSNLSVILSSSTSQILQGSGNAIKAYSIAADKTDANITLSSTGGRSDLFIKTWADFNMTGTSLFTDNGSIIQTDDDLFLGGDGASNYNLTGIVRFTGANVTGDMILSDSDGTSAVAAELYSLDVQGGDLEVYPVSGGQTIVVNNDFSIENTATANANSNNFEIGGDYYVHSDAAIDATGISITMNGSADQNISANNGTETFGTLVVNKSGGNINLSDNINVNNLNLTSGLVNTGSDRVYVTNPAIANLSNYSDASYINGNLRRQVNPTGSYDIPVGNSSNYELANIALNSSAGMTYLDASFNPIGGADLDISALGLEYGGVAVETVLDGGFWTITPNAGTTTVNYNVGLSLNGSSNAGATADQHTVIKRTNASSDWGLYGNHNNSTQLITGGTVYAFRNNITSFSDFAIAKNNTNPLPVELINFDVKCRNAVANLEWVTASEINNDYFEVQKSDDGNNWQILGTVKGAGNSNAVLNYQFEDKNNNAKSYYRLKQIDFDGKFEYSPIIVNTCYTDNNAEVIIYPNPCDDILNISISNWNSEFVKYEITNITGQIIYTSKLLITSGFAFDQIETENLKSGMYYIRLYDDTHSISKKINKN